jgi:integrase/recombinase XerC
MNALSIVSPSPPTLSTTDIISLFLAGRNESTLAAYQTDLNDFASFLELPDSRQAAQVFLSRGSGHANRLALEYKNALSARELSPASVNRKLSTLRSLTKLARIIGLIEWHLEVENVKCEAYRDTRGPTESGFKRILRQSEQRTDPKGIRDQATLCLLHDVAMRRGELVSLDLQDVDVYNRTIAVRGKGRREKSRMSLPERTMGVVSAWIQIRGDEPGPLFTNMSRDKNVRGSRLTSTAVYQIVQKFGQAVDLRATPHGLRHTGITTAVERAQAKGVDLDKVRQFSRHAKLATLQIYVDQHENWQGRVAEMVAK